MSTDFFYDDKKMKYSCYDNIFLLFGGSHFRIFEIPIKSQLNFFKEKFPHDHLYRKNVVEIFVCLCRDNYRIKVLES